MTYDVLSWQGATFGRNRCSSDDGHWRLCWAEWPRAAPVTGVDAQTWAELERSAPARASGTSKD